MEWMQNWNKHHSARICIQSPEDSPGRLQSVHPVDLLSLSPDACVFTSACDSITFCSQSISINEQKEQMIDIDIPLQAGHQSNQSSNKRSKTFMREIDTMYFQPEIFFSTNCFVRNFFCVCTWSGCWRGIALTSCTTTIGNNLNVFRHEKNPNLGALAKSVQ